MSSARKRSPVSTKPAASANSNREETPFEALASICSVLVVGLFILTFLAENFVIPSGSMKNTLLIGDHLVVDRITLAPVTNIIGRPLFNYWSFEAADRQLEQTGFGHKLAWVGHVLMHFFPDTRWRRTFHVVR